MLVDRATEVEFAADVSAYFHRRWGVTARDLVPSLHRLEAIGWSGGLERKGAPWMPGYPLIVPLRDSRGEIVSAMRRWIRPTAPDDEKKSMFVGRKYLGVTTDEQLPPMFIGRLDRAASAVGRQGETLYLVEGEPDALLYQAAVEIGVLRGQVIGFCGGAAGASKRWYSEIAKALRAAGSDGTADVVLAVHGDRAGDGYAALAQCEWPDARRIVYPHGRDATDIVLDWGLDGLRAVVATARRQSNPWWILDGGGYAYHDGETWQQCTGKDAIRSHVRDCGYDDTRAKSLVAGLRAASDIVCDTSTTEPVVFGRSVRLNTYRGFSLRVDRSQDWGVIRRLISHLCDGDEIAVGYVLDWLAAPVQSLQAGRGAHKVGVALVFYGAQGSGKGWLSEVIHALYGSHWLEIGQGQLEDSFAPGDLEKCLLLVANEVASGGAGRESALLNKLKSWTTEDTLQLRGMHRRARAIESGFNIAYLSNGVSPIRIEQDDRRHSFFEQWAKIPDGLIVELVAAKADGWACMRGFFAHLLSRSVTREKFRPFENRARSRQIGLSLASYEAFTLEVARFGLASVVGPWEEAIAVKYRGSYPPIGWKVAPDEKTCEIPTTRLYEVYSLWSKANGHLKPARVETLIEVLRREIPSIIPGERVYVGGRQARGVKGVPYRMDGLPGEVSAARARVEKLRKELERVREHLARLEHAEKLPDEFFGGGGSA